MGETKANGEATSHGKKISSTPGLTSSVAVHGSSQMYMYNRNHKVVRPAGLYFPTAGLMLTR